MAATPGSAQGEILILEDGDGDGRMDTRTVFADGLDHVSSLLLHRDGVIVARSSEILFLRDDEQRPRHQRAGSDELDLHDILPG